MTATDGVSRLAKLRLAIVLILFLVCFGLVELRLVRLQLLEDPELQDLALRQFRKSEKTAYYRLPIFDRNGEELAVSVPSSSVFARPRLIRNKPATARVLAQVLGGTPRRWLFRLRTNRPFVWIQRQLDAALAKRLTTYNLQGIFLETENKRVYPNGSLAAHVLGFTDIDGQGLAGIELSKNSELVVSPDLSEQLKDGRGNASYIASPKAAKESDRGGIFLTIDRRLQHILEEELEATLSSSGAKAAMGVVIDPFSGEVLALGQRPSFDPNQIKQANPAELANRLVSHRFEPGSTLKVLFAAQAMQDGILNPNSLIDCEGGKFKIGNYTVREAEGHQFKILPLKRVIRHSSNVGAVKIAQAIGADRVQSALSHFGLVEKTGIGLPGEVSSAQKDSGFWKPANLAAVGFGHAVSVTPLQIASAFLPFANGGFWIRPRLLLEAGEPQKDEIRQEVRRVLSLRTVDWMREILVDVTEGEGGTGKEARISGVRVAGKTGTAQKYEGAEVGYAGGNYFTSFVGFVPADRAQFLIGVMVDEPKKTYYGSVVAAPLFKRVAERSLQLVGKGPRKAITNVDPPSMALQEAPVPSVETPVIEGIWVMPDLKGVSLREALNLVGPHVSNIIVQGSGYLVGQSPDPGSSVSGQSTVRLHFSASPKGGEG